MAPSNLKLEKSYKTTLLAKIMGAIKGVNIKL